MSVSSTLGVAPFVSELALRSQSDRRLVALTQAGQPQAFGELSRRYHKKLVRYTGRMVGAEHADDIVQQSLLRALRSLQRDDSREIEEPLAWLYRICHNQAVNYLQSRREHFQLNERDQKYDYVRQPHQILEQREELRDIVVLMQGLPERQRVNLALQAFGGLSYDEVAQEMGESVPAVRNLIARARSGLRAGVGGVLPFSLVTRMVGAASSSNPEAAVGFVYAFSGSGRSIATVAAIVAISTAGGVAAVDRVSEKSPNTADASVQVTQTDHEATKLPDGGLKTPSHVPDAASEGDDASPAHKRHQRKQHKSASVRKSHSKTTDAGDDNMYYDEPREDGSSDDHESYDDPSYEDDSDESYESSEDPSSNDSSSYYDEPPSPKQSYRTSKPTFSEPQVSQSEPAPEEVVPADAPSDSSEYDDSSGAEPWD